MKAESGFPLRLENLEKWEDIFQSGNFDQTGKVREFCQFRNVGTMWYSVPQYKIISLRILVMLWISLRSSTPFLLLSNLSIFYGDF